MPSQVCSWFFVPGFKIFIQLSIGVKVTSTLSKLTTFATHFLGPKRKTSDKLSTFEAGVKVVGNARQPFSIKYFLVAILFVLFDVEVIFMYPWAVNFEELGWPGVIEMFIFMGTLLLGFIYILKKKALDWN
ncbi:MAG: NADH-quinone oxidoreductase subunit A [Chitinophagaceae bacterium]|nr:MAG: NADH-quinone oxidoreductase subunit A [Chitinophagaceae bacterium]